MNSRDIVRRSKERNMQYNMIKHIHETPEALRTTLTEALPAVAGIGRRMAKRGCETIILTGCGASYHDALAAKYTFECLLNIPTLAIPASEVGLYPKAFFTKKRCLVAISRSGEKADIMAAVRKAKAASSPVLAVTATPDSLLAREADEVILTSEGPEYCQPKTKSYVSVIGILNLLAIQMMPAGAKKQAMLKGLLDMPRVLGKLIKSCEGSMADLAPQLKKFQHAYVTGMQSNLGSVLEGALKLKETSFIHAEGFPTGEVAQGPLLLPEKGWAYIAFITEEGRDLAIRMTKAAHRKGATVIALSENTAGLKGFAHSIVRIPHLPTELFAPMAYIIPVQFIAYYLAMEKKLNCDDPKGFDMILELILEPGRHEPEMRK